MAKRKATRRGNGEGSIWQRPDGRWLGQISLGYDEDGKLKFEDVSSQGYGCMALSSNGLKTVYHLEKPVDDETKKEYLEIIEEEEIDKDNCYLTMWDEGKKEVVAVFGTLPKTYDELYCDNREEGEEHVDNG